MSEDLKFPIGKFVRPESVSREERDGYLERIRTTPERFTALIEQFDPAKLDTPYREGGWTIRQVVHHVPDSHLQAYSRTKLALTEDHPAITAYREADWANLRDTMTVPVKTSLTMLECLHRRWVAILEGLSEDQWKREYIHPKMGGVSLETMVALYAWHGDHHMGHVRIVAGTR